MQIKNLMSEDLITVDKDQNLPDDLKLLRKHNVSRLPVTNNKELVGIISERDIANKLGSSKYESMPASRLHISSVMVKDVFTVPETMQLDEVARLMLENGIGSVPVMNDASGRIDGGIYHRIVLSIHLVFVVKYLDAEQSDDQYGRYDTQTDEQLVLSVKLHRILLFSVIRCESVHNYQ